MIIARGVTVRVGPTTLVGGIDLELYAGEVTAVVGPNGAGKSTLLGALAGERKLSSGTVTVRGQPLHLMSFAERARARAVLPQRSELSLAFTAREVVQLAGDTISRTLADRCLAQVELEAFADREYPTLSGGERQRVQLARVLAQLAGAPGAALFLDEPTAALDPKHQHVVLDIARRAAAEERAVVIVLHDLTLAARCADRVVLMSKGTVLADGEPAVALAPDLLARAYHTSFEVLRGTGGLVIAHDRAHERPS
jgi:iron complex transport system ATP-binding protein